jgi:hypothetical protein
MQFNFDFDDIHLIGLGCGSQRLCRGIGNRMKLGLRRNDGLDGIPRKL